MQFCTNPKLDVWDTFNLKKLFHGHELALVLIFVHVVKTEQNRSFALGAARPGQRVPRGPNYGWRRPKWSE